MQANDLFTIIDANRTIGLKEKDFERASIVILHHLGNGICKLPGGSVNYTYVDYLYDVIRTPAPSSTQFDMPSAVQTFNTLPADLNFKQEQLHYILELIKYSYTPKTVNKVSVKVFVV